MATTTTDLESVINEEFIDPLIQDYAIDAMVASPLCRIGDLRGKSTKTWSVPVWLKNSAAAVAEAASVNATALVAEDVTITVGEFGIRRDPTKLALRTAIVNVEEYITQESGRLCMEQVEDDIVGLFPSVTASKGTSGAAPTLADFVGMVAALNAALAQGEKVFIGHGVQTGHFLGAIAASGSVVFTGGANQSLVDGQKGQNGWAGQLMNVDLYQSNLCDTANGGADRVGCMFINGNGENGGNPRHAAFGLAILWMPELERDLDAPARKRVLVTTVCAAAGALQDFAAVKLVSKATA